MDFRPFSRYRLIFHAIARTDERLLLITNRKLHKSFRLVTK